MTTNIISSNNLFKTIVNGIKRAVKFVIDVLLFIPRVIYKGIKSLYIDHCRKQYIDCDDFVEIEEEDDKPIGLSSSTIQEKEDTSGEVVLEEAKEFEETENKSQPAPAEKETKNENKSQSASAEKETKNENKSQPAPAEKETEETVVAVTTVEETENKSQPAPAEKETKNENKSQSASAEKETKNENKSQPAPAEKETKNENKSQSASAEKETKNENKSQSASAEKETKNENKSQPAPAEKETKNEKPETKQDPEPVEKVEGEVVSDNESASNSIKESVSEFRLDDRYAAHELSLINEINCAMGCLVPERNYFNPDILHPASRAARHLVLVLAERYGYQPDTNEIVSISGEGTTSGEVEFPPYRKRIEFLKSKKVLRQETADFLRQRIERHLRASCIDWKYEMSKAMEITNKYFSKVYTWISDHPEEWNNALQDAFLKYVDPQTGVMRNKPLSDEDIQKLKGNNSQSAPTEKVTKNESNSQSVVSAEREEAA